MLYRIQHYGKWMKGFELKILILLFNSVREVPKVKRTQHVVFLLVETARKFWNAKEKHESFQYCKLWERLKISGHYASEM